MNGRWPGIGVSRAAAALWTPADLPGLYSWHEAWDPLTVIVDASQRVTQWTDKSGAGRHYTQGDTARMFTYNSATGLLVASANGRQMNMLNDTNNSATAITLAVAGVFSGDANNDNGANAVFRKGSAPWGTPGFYLDNVKFINASNASDPIMIGAPPGNPVLLSFTWNASGGASFNRGEPGATVFGAFANGTQTTARAIGNWANNRDDNNDFIGDLACMIESTTAVGVSDRQKLEGYVAHGAGIASSLPADHPYRSTPPTK